LELLSRVTRCEVCTCFGNSEVGEIIFAAFRTLGRINSTTKENLVAKQRLVVSSLRIFHGRLWGDIKISSVSMFGGDMECMPYIDEGNCSTLVWPVTFGLASVATLGTGIRTHGTDSVST
jgi:hypothetical protein